MSERSVQEHLKKESMLEDADAITRNLIERQSARQVQVAGKESRFLGQDELRQGKARDTKRFSEAAVMMRHRVEKAQARAQLRDAVAEATNEQRAAVVAAKKASLGAATRCQWPCRD